MCKQNSPNPVPCGPSAIDAERNSENCSSNVIDLRSPSSPAIVPSNITSFSSRPFFSRHFCIVLATSSLCSASRSRPSLASGKTRE